MNKEAEVLGLRIFHSKNLTTSHWVHCLMAICRGGHGAAQEYSSSPRAGIVPQPTLDAPFPTTFAYISLEGNAFLPSATGILRSFTAIAQSLLFLVISSAERQEIPMEWQGIEPAEDTMRQKQENLGTQDASRQRAEGGRMDKAPQGRDPSLAITVTPLRV